MKKICAALVIMFILTGGLAFANESKLYARSFNLEKVYLHAKGYKVTYITGNYKYVSTFLPHAWFSHSSSRGGVQSKGELVFGHDASYPYMTVFWKEGKFSHVRLHLKKDPRDTSYGQPSPFQDQSVFDIEEPHLEY